MWATGPGTAATATTANIVTLALGCRSPFPPSTTPHLDSQASIAGLPARPQHAETSRQKQN